ncbi:MAG: YicC family protein, partial [Alphaproteobacteria bacterium]|nr:YicC family protein [Alphaproteobacteria bacterium]
PAGYESFEPRARAIVQERLSRGHIALTLQPTHERRVAGVALNRALLDQVLALVRDVGPSTGVAPARLDGLLALPGVLDPIAPADTEADRDAREPALCASLIVAVEALVAMRQREGAALGATLAGQLDEIERWLSAAEAEGAVLPAALRARMQEQLALLLGAAPVSEERLAQEVALLLVRGDVREELDRLRLHLLQARELLAGGGAVGRKLDFLAQELNREANTLCAKAPSAALSRHGLELKAVIDRFREQIQNLE